MKAPKPLPAKSSRSTRAVRKPRVAASTAIPQPVAPPPMTRISNGLHTELQTNQALNNLNGLKEGYCTKFPSARGELMQVHNCSNCKITEAPMYSQLIRTSSRLVSNTHVHLSDFEVLFKMDCRS
jgi:hypothetical protein